MGVTIFAKPSRRKIQMHGWMRLYFNTGLCQCVKVGRSWMLQIFGDPKAILRDSIRHKKRDFRQGPRLGHYLERDANEVDSLIHMKTRLVLGKSQDFSKIISMSPGQHSVIRGKRAILRHSNSKPCILPVILNSSKHCPPFLYEQQDIFL